MKKKSLIALMMVVVLLAVTSGTAFAKVEEVTPQSPAEAELFFINPLLEQVFVLGGGAWLQMPFGVLPSGALVTVDLIPFMDYSPGPGTVKQYPISPTFKVTLVDGEGNPILKIPQGAFARFCINMTDDILDQVKDGHNFYLARNLDALDKTDGFWSPLSSYYDKVSGIACTATGYLNGYFAVIEY